MRREIEILYIFLGTIRTHHLHQRSNESTHNSVDFLAGLRFPIPKHP